MFPERGDAIIGDLVYRFRVSRFSIWIGGGHAQSISSPLRYLRHSFARLRLRHGNGRNPRRRAPPSTSLEPFPYKLEDGSPILCNHLQPCHFPHHGEINAAETDSRKEDVDAITQGLVVQRLNRMRQRLRTLRLCPPEIPFTLGLTLRH